MTSKVFANKLKEKGDRISRMMLPIISDFRLTIDIGQFRKSKIIIIMVVSRVHNRALQYCQKQLFGNFYYESIP